MLKKKTLALTLVASMLLSTTSMAANVSTFTDMPNDYSTQALVAAVQNGLFQGDNNLIYPDGYLTRGEFAAIMTRAFGAIKTADMTGFTDVDTKAWYADYLSKAVAMGIMEGDGTCLNPNAPITRQEVCTMLSRVFSLTSDGDVSNFSDADSIADWALSSVAAMTEAGYIVGSNGKVMPTDNILRKDFAVIMDRMVASYVSDSYDLTSKVIEGNLIITSADVSLDGITVTGNIIIADGVTGGYVDLNNVTVEGDIIIRSSAAVNLLGTTAPNIIVTDNTENTQLVVAGTSKIGTITANGTGATIMGAGTVSNIIVQGNDTSISTYKTKVQVADNVTGTTAGGKDAAAGSTTTTVKPVIKKYVVKFDDQDGNPETTIKSKTIQSGKTVIFPDAPTREGYTFEGWNTKADGTGTSYAAGDGCKVTATITFYAIWAEDGTPTPTPTYTVSFDDQDGNPETSIPSQTVQSGKTVTLPDAPTREGFVFQYWNTKADGSGAGYFPTETYPITSAITFYAIWEEYVPPVTTYTVSFVDQDGDDSTNIADKTGIASDTTVILPTEPTRSGYTFLEWNTKADGTGTEFTASTTVTKNMTVYAIWEVGVDYRYISTFEMLKAWTELETPVDGTIIANIEITEAIVIPADVTLTLPRYCVLTGATSETLTNNGTIVSHEYLNVQNLLAIKDSNNNGIGGTIAADLTKSTFPGIDVYGGTTLSVRNSIDINRLDVHNGGTLSVEETATLDIKGGWMGIAQGATFINNGTVINNAQLYFKVCEEDALKTSLAIDGRVRLLSDLTTTGDITVPDGTTLEFSSILTIGAGKTLTIEEGGAIVVLGDLVGADATSTLVIEGTVGGMEQGTYTWDATNEVWAMDGAPATTYTVSFDDQDGDDSTNVDDIADIESGDTVTLPTEPTRDGYTFLAWNTKADGTGTEFTASTTVTANITVYAIWEVVAPTTFTVTFDDQDGDDSTNVDDITDIESGDTVTLPTEPTRSGYTFLEWNTASDGTGTEFTASTTVTANVTVYAIWGYNVASQADIDNTTETILVATADFDLSGNNAVPADKTLYIPSDRTLNVPISNHAMITGTVINNGTLNGVSCELYLNAGSNFTNNGTLNNARSNLYLNTGSNFTNNGTFTNYGSVYVYDSTMLNDVLSTEGIYGTVSCQQTEGNNLTVTDVTVPSDVILNGSITINGELTIEEDGIWEFEENVTLNATSVTNNGIIHMNNSVLTTANLAKIDGIVHLTSIENDVNDDLTIPDGVTLTILNGNDSALTVNGNLTVATGGSLVGYGNTSILVVTGTVTGMDDVAGAGTYTWDTTSTTWVAETYTVTFDHNYTDDTDTTDSIEPGANVTIPADPTRTHYVFLNWNTKADGTGTSYVAGDTYEVNEATTFYAMWAYGVESQDDINNAPETVLVATRNFDLDGGTALAISSRTTLYIPNDITLGVLHYPKIEGTLINNGTLTIKECDLNVYGTLVNNGTLISNGLCLTSDSNFTNNGTLINNNLTLESDSNFTNNGAITNNDLINVYDETMLNYILNMENMNGIIRFQPYATIDGDIIVPSGVRLKGLATYNGALTIDEGGSFECSAASLGEDITVTNNGTIFMYYNAVTTDNLAKINGKVTLPNGNAPINNGLTIPANVTCTIPANSDLSVSSVLTITGRLLGTDETSKLVVTGTVTGAAGVTGVGIYIWFNDAWYNNADYDNIISMDMLKS